MFESIDMGAIIEAGREWLLECDAEEDFVSDLSNIEVLSIVKKNFHGGLVDFIRCM